VEDKFLSKDFNGVAPIALVQITLPLSFVMLAEKIDLCFQMDNGNVSIVPVSIGTTVLNANHVKNQSPH